MIQIGVIQRQQRRWMGHIIWGNALLGTIIERRMYWKRQGKTKNDVIGLEDEGGLQQVEGESLPGQGEEKPH